MSKKIVIIASAFTAVVLLSSCTSREPIPVVQSANPTNPSMKLGPVHHHCVHCDHR